MAATVAGADLPDPVALLVLDPLQENFNRSVLRLNDSDALAVAAKAIVGLTLRIHAQSVEVDPQLTLEHRIEMVRERRPIALLLRQATQVENSAARA